jgi:hypothetical protein
VEVISTKVLGFSKDQLRYMLIELISYGWSDDLEGDFYEIVDNDADFKELGE